MAWVLRALFFFAVGGIFFDPLLARGFEEPALILEGEDGFIYFLVFAENGEPARSADGSLLYEGRRGKLQISTSLKSLIAREHLTDRDVVLHSKDWVKDAVSVQLSPDAIVRLLDFFRNHPDQFQSLFNGLSQTKVNLFRSILFERKLVLTGAALRELSRKAFSSHPSDIRVPIYIEENFAQRNILNMITDIEGSRFTFYFRNKSIYFGPLVSRDSPLPPAKPLMKPGIRIHLAVQKAVLEGPTHDIGRVRGVWEYENQWEHIGQFGVDAIVLKILNSLGASLVGAKSALRFYDDRDQLTKGEIENMELTLGISFEEVKSDDPQQTLWRVNIEEPLNLIMDTSPKVKLWFKKRPPPENPQAFEPHPADEDDTFPSSPPHILGLPESAKAQIQTTLSSTLQEAFRSIFFGTDLAFRIPLSAPSYELEFGSRSPQEFSPVSADARLAGVDILDGGLKLRFDSRLSVRELPSCIRENPGAILSQVREGSPLQRPEVPSVGWSVESRVPLPMVNSSGSSGSSSLMAGSWRGQSPPDDQKNDSSLSSVIHIRENYLHLLHLGAYAGGLYCMSSRAQWPRPDYVPLIKFRPSRLPKLQFDEDQVQLQLEGELETLVLRPPSLEEGFQGEPLTSQFDLIDRRRMTAEGRIRNLSNIRSVVADPIDALKVGPSEKRTSIDRASRDGGEAGGSFSDEENEFVQRLLNIIYFSEADDQKRAKSYQMFVTDWLSPSSPDAFRVDAMNWSKNGVTLRLGIQSFDWLGQFLNRDPELKTLKFTHIPQAKDLIRTSEGSVELAWMAEEMIARGKQIEKKPYPVFVSYRQRRNEEDWGALSSLRSGDSLRVFLRDPGRYHFQVFALDRSFQWLPRPITFEVEYDPKRKFTSVPTVKLDWKEPESQVERELPSSGETHPTESSKGPFGCALNANASSMPKPLLVVWSWLVLGLIIVLRRRSRQTVGEAERSIE